MAIGTKVFIFLNLTVVLNLGENLGGVEYI